MSPTTFPPPSPFPRWAVVTGSGSGIGWATAQTLAASGHGIVLVDKAFPAEVRAWADGQGFPLVTGDVRDEATLAALDAALAHCPAVAVLVLAAGVQAPSPLNDDEAWAHVMGVNVDGARRVLARVAPRLGKQGEAYAHVIALSSIMARYAFPGFGAYAVSKAALDAMVRTWALELGPRGVLVNGIAPGWVDTPMAADVFATLGALTKKDPGALWERARKASPLGKVATPAEVAALVAFLVSGAQTSMTGQTLVIDNGLSCVTP